MRIHEHRRTPRGGQNVYDKIVSHCISHCISHHTACYISGRLHLSLHLSLHLPPRRRRRSRAIRRPPCRPSCRPHHQITQSHLPLAPPTALPTPCQPPHRTHGRLTRHSLNPHTTDRPADSFTAQPADRLLTKPGMTRMADASHYCYYCYINMTTAILANVIFIYITAVFR